MVNALGNIADAAVQFALPDHASNLAELLALADRALSAVKEKRRGSIGWVDISPSSVVPG